ncbi:hypothetical protein P0E69_04670 [Chimaeribacter arupi]|uniref:hypothetical protein n=1 Tax=Chimaeribacter arupi TaxID=2060066 RepID=UPI002711DE4A|nr:hypothetical protein [Chimaeribacter arupi]WKZ93223.1 hypothetical protein P0E69_04670 [Chimaeribacter arupi]
MALPIEFRNERAEYLEQEASKYQVSELWNLTNEDFMILGKYIQMYCFIELNIHRLFNSIVSAELFKIKLKGRVSIPCILDKLIELVGDNLVESSKVDETIGKLKEIKFRRDYRNIFAHWAAKRIPNEDGMIFFASDDSDFKKIFGKKIEADMAAYAIFDVADIRGLVTHLSSYEEWIAHFSAEVYEQHKKHS